MMFWNNIFLSFLSLFSSWDSTYAHVTISNIDLRSLRFLKILFSTHTGLLYLLYVISNLIVNCPMKYFKLYTGQFMVLELSFWYFVILKYKHFLSLHINESWLKSSLFNFANPGLLGLISIACFFVFFESVLYSFFLKISLPIWAFVQNILKVLWVSGFYWIFLKKSGFLFALTSS